MLLYGNIIEGTSKDDTSEKKTNLSYGCCTNPLNWYTRTHKICSLSAEHRWAQNLIIQNTPKCDVHEESESIKK